MASSVERLYARLVLYTQEFACLEPDKAEVIRGAPKNADGNYPELVYVEQLKEKLRAIDPDTPIDDEGEGLFWSENLWEFHSDVGVWRSIPPEEWWSLA